MKNNKPHFKIFTLFLLNLSSALAQTPSLDPVAKLDSIDVTHYSFKINALHYEDIKSPLLITEEITLKANETLLSIPLHFNSEHITIHSLTERNCSFLKGMKCVNQSRKYNILTVSKNGEVAPTILKIERISELQKNKSTTFTIQYEVKTLDYVYPKNPITEAGGLLRTILPSQDSILNTQSWPYFARNWAILNDHPADPATVEFTFILPPHTQAYANGGLTSESIPLLNSEKNHMLTWKSSKEIQTYDFNFMIGKFQSYTLENKESSIQPVLIWNSELEPNIEPFKKEMERIKNAFNLFNKFLGTYPYEKLIFARVPHPYNMESTTLISIVSVPSMVHELVHQWWGNTVKIKTWNDFWLSEGFTTYFTGYFDEIMTGKNTAQFLTKGILRHNEPSIDPLSIFDATPYRKGAAALDDLRLKISTLAHLEKGSKEEQEFFQQIFSHVWKKLSFSNVTTEDMIHALQNELSFSILKYNPTIDSKIINDLFNQWKITWLESL